MRTLYREIQDAIQGIDNFSFPVVYLRTINETATSAERILRWGAIFRGLIDIAKIEIGVKGGFAYFSRITDTAHAAGAVFRSLFVFIRILTASFVRDYLLRRFLIAREELALKSVISREITLDSRIS